MTARNVVHNGPKTKQRVSGALSAGWARVCAQTGKGAFADKIEVTTRTIDNALTGTTLPELHTAFNSLVADPTALDEVAALYGFVIQPKHSEAANDLKTASCLSHLAGQIIDALSDGYRDHRETLAIAKIARPLSKMLSALIDEADQISGVVEVPVKGRVA